MELRHYTIAILYTITYFYTYVFIFKDRGKPTYYGAGQLTSHLSFCIPSWCPTWHLVACEIFSQTIFKKVLDRCCESLLMSDRSQTKGYLFTTIFRHLSSS